MTVERMLRNLRQVNKPGEYDEMRIMVTEASSVPQLIATRR